MIVDKLGRYRLTESITVRTVTSVATLPAGGLVTVTQIDPGGHKVYGPELLDWRYWDLPVEPVSYFGETLATPAAPSTPQAETAVEAPDLDPFLVHELLHGASLAVDLLETVGGGDVYAPVWAAAPEAKRAFDAAVDAAAAFYQAMGCVTAGDLRRALSPRESAGGAVPCGDVDRGEGKGT